VIPDSELEQPTDEAMQAPQAVNFNNQFSQSLQSQPFFAGSGQVLPTGIPQQIHFNSSAAQAAA